MTWNQIVIRAKAGRHVRREAWPDDCWLVYQRGVAWFWTGAAWRVVTGEDFSEAEWNATDWTTIPPRLADCPPDGGGDDGDDDGDGGGDPPVIIPEEGGWGGWTGGGVKPTPPRPDPKPGCSAEITGLSAAIYCPNPSMPHMKSVAVSFSATGNGLWSGKARVGNQNFPLSLKTLPNAFDGGGQIECAEGKDIPVHVTLSGWGNCAPAVMAAATEAKCSCGPYCKDYDFSQNVSGTINDCHATPYGQVTVANPFPFSCDVRITGSVDDELLLDGEIIGDGDFLFAPWSGGTSACNGAHEVDHSFVLPAFGSFSLACGDNHGYISSYGLTVCMEAVAAP